MNEKTHYIYTLCDPNTNEVRYVGRTSNPSYRLGRHMHPGFSSQSMKRWLRTLETAPVMNIIETCDRAAVVGREQYWIDTYRAAGANLINKGSARHGRG